VQIEKPLSIRIPPNFAECTFCTKTYIVKANSYVSYCSRGCVFMALNPGPKKFGEPVKPLKVKPDVGPCDCDEYEQFGYCSITVSQS